MSRIAPPALPTRGRPSAVALAVLAALALGAPASASAAPAPPANPVALVAATVRQDAFELVARVRTRGAWSVISLGRRPGRLVCLALWRRGQAKTPTTLCLAPDRHGAARVVLGRPGQRPVALRNGRVGHPEPTLHTLRVRWARAGFTPGRWRWHAASAWSDAAGCATPVAACASTLPRRGFESLSLHVPRPVGCRATGASYRTHGPTGRRVVGLAFDDGPSADTPGFLRTLERLNVPATFFVIGGQVGARAGLLHRMLADGDAIGNHTWSHPNVSGDGPFAARQIASTTRAIQRATGFRPCLFRAPYGGVSGALIAQARAFGMATIGWNVDPSDYLRPGAGVIAARVLAQVRPGSITVMHDGPALRGQTLAAVPIIVRALRRRGYRFKSVPDLLGFPIRYR